MPNKMPSSRDIDKEKMFRKIMPSASAPVGDAAETAAPAAETPMRNVIENAAAKRGNQTTKAQTPPAEVPTPPETGKETLQERPNKQPAEEEKVEPMPEPKEPMEQAAPNPQETEVDVAPPAPKPAHFVPDVNPVLTGVDDSNALQPVNLVELLVDRYYPRYRQRLDGCECQRCKDDVYGMALNKISPRYVRSDQLSEEDLTNRALITETVAALMQALFTVKRNPHHDDKNPMRQ